MGLLRGKLLPDALLGTSVDEAAGILGPDGKWGSSGELLDLPIPEDSLGGEIPVGMFCQTQHTRVPGRTDAQAPPGETRKLDRDETNAQEVPRRGTGCGDATTSGEAKRHGQTKLYKGEQVFKPLPTKGGFATLAVPKAQKTKLLASSEKLIWP